MMRPGRDTSDDDDYDDDDDDGYVPQAGPRNNLRQPDRVEQANQEAQPIRPELEYKLDGPLFGEDEFQLIGKLLGKGTQGNVWKAENILLGTCAIKRMNIANGRFGRGESLDAYYAYCREFLEHRQAMKLISDVFQLTRDAKREFVNIHKVSHHDNIVGFRGYLTKSCKLPSIGDVTLFIGLIFEFMAGETLENMVKHDQDALGDMNRVPDVDHPPALDYPRILNYAKCIARALTFLHEKLNIIHRHIHPSNIFLTGDFSVAKLGDFGYARSNGTDKNGKEIKGMTSKKGAIKYMAPEVINECEFTHYDYKAEVWSFSMLLYAMLCKREPSLRDEKNAEITCDKSRREKLKGGARPEIEDTYRSTYSDMVRLIEDGWKTKPEDRPTMLKILERLTQIPEIP